MVFWYLLVGYFSDKWRTEDAFYVSADDNEEQEDDYAYDEAAKCYFHDDVVVGTLKILPWRAIKRIKH